MCSSTSQGVDAWGILDTGADITIMGPDLFKKVASLRRLKKRNFHQPDKVPKTYDRRTFTLDGRMELEITFGGKAMLTTVYIKMDAHDQLLLSEGVCRQLEMVQYHPEVQLWSRKLKDAKLEAYPEKLHLEDSRIKEAAIVPTVRVRLLQSVTVLPLQATHVQAEVEDKDGILLMEPKNRMAEGTIQLEPSLLHVENGIAQLQVTNFTGFT